MFENGGHARVSARPRREVLGHERVSPLLGSAKETTVLRDVNDVFVYHFESISTLVLSVNGQKCSPLLGSDKFNT